MEYCVFPDRRNCMSKIICDICGTTYPETAESCPICGYSRDFDLEEIMDEDFLLEDEEILTYIKAGKVSDGNENKKNKEIFDFDAVNEELEDEESEEEESGEDEEYEEEPKSNTFLVILLVIIITLLLVASGFLFFRHLLPNFISAPEVTVPEAATTVPTETETVETAEPTVPCESLVITSDKADLNMEGKNWLLHVVVMPENTTDQLSFVSEDESVATVNAEGRITAVGEGSTNILITCGAQQIKYPVEVRYVEETVSDENVTIPAPTVAETTETDPSAATEATEATQASEATTPAESAPVLKDVVLKLGRTDISLTVGYSFELPIDCDLTYEEIEWSVEHSFIASVKNGVVTALSPGTTAVIAKYGDQVVECLVRCNAG